MQDIINRVCELYDIDYFDMVGKTLLRNQFTNNARFEAWADLYRAGYTLADIASEFDRHHSTILNGIRSFYKGKKNNRELKLVCPPRKKREKFYEKPTKNVYKNILAKQNKRPPRGERLIEKAYHWKNGEIIVSVTMK